MAYDDKQRCGGEHSSIRDQLVTARVDCRRRECVFKVVDQAVARGDGTGQVIPVFKCLIRLLRSWSERMHFEYHCAAERRYCDPAVVRVSRMSHERTGLARPPPGRQTMGERIVN